MTARANSLTKRVTEAIAKAGYTWSMPANDVRAFMNALGCLGYNSDWLLAAAGIRDADLNNRDARISCEALGAVLSHAQRERFTPNLALELAKVTPLGAYPLLDYLVVTSDTVGEGVRQLARYLRLVGNPVTIDLHEEVDPIRVEMASAAAPFSVEFGAYLMILHFRNETDGRFAARNISFLHTPDDVVALEGALGCPVQSKASWNGISVPLDVWHMPLRRRDPVLRQVLETQANDILARLPERTGLALEVQRALAARVAGGDTRINALARQLAMSPRTLQRRLAAEGVSYQELREGARKEAAGRYVSDSNLAVSEVAYLVGYSEPAPFHRAFKRWYGMTPEAFRHSDGEENRHRFGQPRGPEQIQKGIRTAERL
jgi:AraC-like DNA-binding protein